MSTYANSRAIIHAGDGQKFIAAAPDVCKTPSPGGPVPIPYPNFAMSSDLAKGSKKVKIEGNSVAVKGANLKTSTGDEAGTAGGGIISSKTKGKLTWVPCSTDVKFEGKGVIRFLDSTMHNGNSGNSGGASPGDKSTLSYGGDAPCPCCGAEQGHPIPSGKTSEKKASEVAKKSPPHTRKSRKGGTKRKGYMIGVLLCLTPDGKPVTLQACSGKPPRGFKSHPKDKKLTKIDPESIEPCGFKAEHIDNAPGACAAPKLLQAARKLGLKPLEMSEIWQGPRSVKQKPGKHAESCETCKQMLAGMLCDKV